jgi:transcriptional regulator with XRE-family HTH domain
MSVAVIKAITKRIRIRMGSTADAARAAGVSPGVWSGYENADHPETTIPLGRLCEMSLTAGERSAFAALFRDEAETVNADLNTEAGETIETAAELHKMVRLATVDGAVTEAEARPIRAKALETIAQAGDVLKALG